MIPKIRSDIQFLTKYNDASVYIKRDDMIPFSFGGNKVRIAAELFKDAEKKKCDLIISYGSGASNLNRVVAHMAKACGMKCIVICKEEAGEEGDSFNTLMVKYAGAKIVRCDRSSVRETVQKTFEDAEKEGFKPYYAYGDFSGTGNEAVCTGAYEKAFKEIAEYEEKQDMRFDDIFTATGTGMTQAGLLAGCLKAERKTSIHGISIARDAKKAYDSVLGALEAAGFEKDVADAINISDDCLFGGYGKYSEDVENTVLSLMNTYGIPFDPCYSGKAFYGMIREIDKKALSGNILFIHTGGTAGFFDMLKRRRVFGENK